MNSWLADSTKEKSNNCKNNRGRSSSSTSNSNSNHTKNLTLLERWPLLLREPVVLKVDAASLEDEADELCAGANAEVSQHNLGGHLGVLFR